MQAPPPFGADLPAAKTLAFVSKEKSQRMAVHAQLMEPIDLLELDCPFLTVINPHADVVEAQAIEWGRRFRLITNDHILHAVRATKAGWLVAWAYPHADREALQLIADWNIWLLIWEDRSGSPEIGAQPERLKAIHTRFLEILSGAAAEPAEGPLEHGLQDLRQRLLQKTTMHWLGQFQQSVLEVFDSWVWEATNRSLGNMPNVETYLRMRPTTGALNPYLHFIAITDQLHLPRAVRDHPYIHRLTLMANNIICWSNDLFSFHKELQHGDVHNLVLILQHHNQLSLHDAAQHVVQLHNAEVSAFLDLAARAPAFSHLHAHLDRYVAMLRHWIRANMNWATVSGRYNLVNQKALGQ